MGASQLSAAALSVVLWAAALPAQGQVYRERWGYLHLEHRREQLLAALRGCDDAAMATATRELLEPDQGVPFVPIARALAKVRGVEADAAFMLRSVVSSYVLPEVADPDGSNEACRRTSVSLFLPFAVQVPEHVVFDFDVRDAAGERAWSAQLDMEPTLEDLRMARLVAPIPAGELADGSYLLTVRTRVGGVDATAADPCLQWPFHVLRGYQARCEQAFAAARQGADALPPEQRAQLLGCTAAVQRAYSGEAFDGESRAVADLLRLEQVLANVAAERHALTGITGDVPVQLPTADAFGMQAVLRLPSDFDPVAARHRPLVVFAGATPAYDATGRRPTSPMAKSPVWTARELPTFGARAGCDVAFVESPGAVRDYREALLAALPMLRRMFGTGDAPLLLVADGEAATIAAFHAARFAPELQGLVLVGAGAMTGPVLDGLGALPVRMQPVAGRVSGDGLRRSLDYVATRQAAGAWHGDVALLGQREVPWLLALPLLTDEIESFAADVFARHAASK